MPRMAQVVSNLLQRKDLNMQSQPSQKLNEAELSRAANQSTNRQNTTRRQVIAALAPSGTRSGSWYCVASGWKNRMNYMNKNGT